MSPFSHKICEWSVSKKVNCGVGFSRRSKIRCFTVVCFLLIKRDIRHCDAQMLFKSEHSHRFFHLYCWLHRFKNQYYTPHKTWTTARNRNSLAQLTYIPNRVWKSLHWLVRYCSYSAAVPRDSSLRLHKASHRRVIVRWRASTSADPWLGGRGFGCNTCHSLLKKHRLLWPAPPVQSNFSRKKWSPFDVSMEDELCVRVCSCLLVCCLHVRDCLRGDVSKNNFIFCSSQRPASAVAHC